MPSIVKKTILTKGSKKMLSSFQNTNSTQTSGAVFADGIEQVKMTEFEIQITSVVDCFLDGHGNYTSKLKPFKIISL